MLELNETIAAAPLLGRHFRIGHSFVTPRAASGNHAVDWFRAVVETEIGPLLEEYWFDAQAKGQEAREALLNGLGP